MLFFFNFFRILFKFYVVNRKIDEVLEVINVVMYVVFMFLILIFVIIIFIIIIVMNVLFIFV